MQNVLIKIIGQPHFHPSLTVDIGPGYKFLWNDAITAYSYAPTKQSEIDDIFLSKSLHNGVWDFAPHFLDGPYVAPVGEASEAALPAEDREFLQSEIANRDEQIAVATKRIAELKDGMSRLKAESDKAIKLATDALKSAPKPSAKPHWKTLAKQSKANRTAQPCEPVVTVEEALPAE